MIHVNPHYYWLRDQSVVAHSKNGNFQFWHFWPKSYQSKFFFREKCQQYGIKLIYETDDDLLGVEENSPSYEYVNRVSKSIEDFIDFCIRMTSQSINKKVIISLILSGAFDSFEYNKKTLINTKCLLECHLKIKFKL